MSSYKFTNRLIHEKSPYLLVDWYPWGEEAFNKAREENKPIFLSVGYSTCHWCHVMEHESFENEDIAEVMNKYFINIKVDREENPGVDKFYMTFVQLQSGGGGWPMSVFLTSDLHPFFGGTYFPPKDMHGRPGFKTLLTRIAQLWVTNPDKLKESGQKTVAQIKAYCESRPQGSSSSREVTPWSVAEATFKHFRSRYDDKEGGFGKAPKFPTPVQLLFLLDYYGYQNKTVSSNDAEKALEMVLFTLQKIAAGGIHDHIGSGFHRYSTDSHWHVPHFEKMLYDQAQLLVTYARAYQITHDSQYADAARDIVCYVARDLAHEEGAFYAAEDADSLPATTATATTTTGITKKKEGAFCVWTASELVDRLGPDASAVFTYRYGVKEHGNVDPDQDPHNELKGNNVLYVHHTLENTAQKFGMSKDQAETILKDAVATLLAIRQNERPKPHRDDKILTSWNGLMISGLAQASQILEDKNMLVLAIKAATFIRNNMYNEDTKMLIRSFREGPSNINGFVDDYSYLIQGLIDLYDATFDEQWIQWAYDLQQNQNDLFYDEVNGGYYSTQRSDESILVRLKDEQDGAEPSPNAVAVANLTRLSTLLQDMSLSDKAQKTIQAFEETLAKYPYSMPYFVSAFLLAGVGVKEILLASNDEHIVKEYQKTINQVFIPNKLVVRVAKDSGILAQRNSVIQGIASKLAEEKDISVYICENFVCGMPVHDIKDVIANLSRNTTHV